MTDNILNDLFYSVFPSTNKYLTHYKGDTNILLSAPHGGSIRPINIPYRSYGNRSRDTYTKELIKKIINFSAQKPYYIYSNIHRSRVDLNRGVIEGAQGNERAINIWEDWNNTLNSFSAEIRNKYKKGIYVDIHSHSNSDKFQVGYGLSVNSYLDIKSGWETKTHSTMYTLKPKSDKSEYEVLFGENSVIGTLESYGFDVLVPEEEAKYLNGGRNIKQWSDYGIGAVQIESPISILKDELEVVAIAICNAIEVIAERYCNV